MPPPDSRFAPEPGSRSPTGCVNGLLKWSFAASTKWLRELHRLVIERGVTAASAATIARWLAEDAIKPWQYRSWVFPRDPRFAERAGPVLDLYQRRWEDKLLPPGDYVISADEKTQIQARGRIHGTLPGAAGRPMRVEHEYERGGAGRSPTSPRGTCIAAG